MKIWNKINKSLAFDKIDPYKNFCNITWENKVKKKVLENYKKLISNKTIKSNYFIACSPLPFLLIGQNKKKIKICDFGSGGLEIYFQIQTLNIKNSFLIDAVEVPQIYKLYNKLKIKYLKNSKKVNISFLDHYDFKKKYDIVHISDSLQYIKDWRNFIKKIIKTKPKYIILNNLTAGEIPEYSTTQNFYNKKIFYKFFNLNQVIKNFKNYYIVYSGQYLNKINGKYSEYPQSNFKKTDRLSFPCTVILKLKL